MKIKCLKDVLLNNINIVSKAVPNKTIRPIQECILITANENGFTLTANDEKELGIETVNIEAEIIQEGSIAIKAKMFNDIIRNLPENEVIIYSDNSNITCIESGKSVYKIQTEESNEFIKLPEIEKKYKCEISEEVFKNMIKQTIFSVAVDDVRKFLTGELIEIKNNCFNIVAIDGNRVAFRTNSIENFDQDIRVTVPAKTLNEISKILSDKDQESKINIYFDENHILFETKSCQVVSRLIEGEYLNYEQFFNNDDNGSIVEVNKFEFLKSIERATLISNDSTKNPVKLEIKENSIIVSSNTEFGNSIEEIAITLEGLGLKIAFNPRYLIEALKVIEDDTISIKFVNPLSPCIIKGIEKNDYRYLIVPIRLRD